jgi:osmoprotectant transport system ATP-binding protein
MLVRFEDVGFRRPGSGAILDRFNLSVEPGEMIALVGRSGAGKTTVLKLVNRLLLPTAGRVLVEGRDTRDWDGIDLRRRIGYVFQDVGLFPHMTIEENVAIAPRLAGWPVVRARERANSLLELVGLPAREFAGRLPSELSGGQRQRVGLARALGVDPPIVLMDEPFGALDPVTRAEMRREFTRIQRQLKTTAILVTHDMAEAFALGTRVGVLDAGALAVYDTPATVARSQNPRVRAFVDAVATIPAEPRPS